MLLRDVALNIFDHDDCVVHYQACSECDSKQRERVDGEAECLNENKGSDERYRNRYRWDDGCSPVKQEEEDDHDDDHNRLGERDENLMDRIPYDGCGIEGNRIFETRGKLLDSSLSMAFASRSTCSALALESCCTPIPTAVYPLNFRLLL